MRPLKWHAVPEDGDALFIPLNEDISVSEGEGSVQNGDGSSSLLYTGDSCCPEDEPSPF